MKKVLLTRFGGIGDAAPMMVVGSQLKKKGYHVTMALREDGPAMRLTDVFYKNPCFDELIDLFEFGPWRNRCVKTQFGCCSINSIYSDFDEVLDYMFIVEGNSTSPVSLKGTGTEWQASRSSNWVNWFDLHLAWANIDPKSVSNEEKRPKFIVMDEEKAVILELKKKHSHLITIQTTASSLSRTWNQSKHLPGKILKDYPEALVVYWDNSQSSWIMFTKAGFNRLNMPSSSPLRASMALVACSDLYIGADTGFSHIAEGLDVKNIAIYSTVPAWTRNQYYKHQITVDPGQKNPEFYTFNLGLGDPLRVAEGEASLTEREKKIDELYKQNLDVREAAVELNTDEEGAKLELESLIKKKASFERIQSKALSSVTADEVYALIKKELK